MKVLLILLVLSIILVSSTTNSFAQSQTKCHFGDSDTPDSEIFTKDVAAKTFVTKYPDSNRTNTVHSSVPLDATLIYKAETESEEITLTIDYRQNENGCYRPKNYQYTYNDGTIDVTVRNTLSSFTEIINLIKSDSKTLRDFYPDDCSFVELEYSLSNGIVYGICKAIDHPTITIQAKAYSDDTLKINIPIEMVYSLPSSDCIPSNDFFVFTASGEKPYDITSTDIGNLIKVELEEGANRITIAGSWIIPNPSPAQYCGIVDGYDKKYLPPLAQLDHEMKPSQIRCNDGLVLIQKYDGTPACVTESTKTKLIERGWTSSSTTVMINSNFEQDRDRIYTNPRNAVIDLEKNNSVKWINNVDYIVQVYDYENKSWSTGQIDPSMSDSIRFNSTGYYEFAVESANDRHFGEIIVISDDTNSLPIETRMKMGMSIVSNDLGKNPALIGVGTGDVNDGIVIDINQNELEKRDDAKSYYYDMYKEMIPFDVPITIEFTEPLKLLE